MVIQPYQAFADVKEDYENAKIEYLSAMVSMATYSDHTGILAREGLADCGWFMRPHTGKMQGVDAKFFVVNNNYYSPDQETYILAVTGTENFKDMKADLSFSKVLFAGNTPSEFVEKAGTKHLTSAEPMVHRGFNKYATAAFFTNEFNDFETYGEYLADFLKEKTNRKLVMVGHSLGGAVVTIGAARLISLGVDPQQLAVITFGAPAVGNASFANQYGKDIDLTRITIKGDPVKGVLQSITGGYVQFGKQTIRQERLNIYKMQHAISVYVDASIRNYYDAKSEMEKSGYEVENNEMVRPSEQLPYFSPLVLQLDKSLAPDEYYMKQVAYDSLRNNLAGFVFGEGVRSSLTEELLKAKQAGCSWLVQGDFAINKVQNQQYSYYISYQENIYEVATGQLKDTLIFTNGTNGKDSFTPIQSIMHNLSDAEEPRLAIINGTKGTAF